MQLQEKFLPDSPGILMYELIAHETLQITTNCIHREGCMALLKKETEL